MAIDLSGYVDVAERVREFYARFPEGSLQSEVIEMTDTRVTVKAWAYRTPDDPRPAVGHSWMAIPGSTSFTRGSEIENCETSAWGRALAGLGFATKQIASRDEVQNKQPSKPVPATSPQAKECPLHKTPMAFLKGKWAHKHDEQVCYGGVA